METTLRPATGAAPGVSAPARPVPARPTASAPDAAAVAVASNSSAGAAPLRGTGTSVDAALQDQAARAQQAMDYLDRVGGQLENLKGELTARLTGARSSTASSASGAARQRLDAQVRQLASTLAARSQSAGGSVDANLSYTDQPALQRFRIRGLDIGSLQQNALQTLSFSIGSVGGPQLSATIAPDGSKDQVARALDRALAPLGVRASLDGQDALVFTTPEASWPAIKDSIAVSGRGKVAADEVPASLAPQQWKLDGGSASLDALRQSLREVVPALERVRRSQGAAGNALSAATAQVSATQTPPPQVELAAQDFASAAASTDYDALLGLSSALVGVSRERVQALLGLR